MKKGRNGCLSVAQRPSELDDKDRNLTISIHINFIEDSVGEFFCTSFMVTTINSSNSLKEKSKNRKLPNGSQNDRLIPLQPVSVGSEDDSHAWYLPHTNEPASQENIAEVIRPGG